MPGNLLGIGHGLLFRHDVLDLGLIGCLQYFFELFGTHLCAEHDAHEQSAAERQGANAVHERHNSS